MTGFSRLRKGSATAVVGVALCALSLTGCGDTDPLGGNGTAADAGFPTVATKNTTRVGASDAAGVAAASSLAVWPGADLHPSSIAFVPGDWKSALAAAPLVAPPFRSAILVADGDIPAATADAMEKLAPTGVRSAGGVKRIVVGDAEDPGDSKRIDGDGAAALADAIDQSRLGSGGTPTDSVVVVGTDGPEWAMPAAAWAARSGDPILFVERDGIPKETIAAIQRRGRPLIMLLAPTDTVSADVEHQLGTYGAVARITGKTPAESSIEFTRFRDGDRGWGITDPGHGLMFAAADDSLKAIVASPLSASGQWPPLLVLREDGSIPAETEKFLLDIQPGYRGDPTRFLYNRGWLIGSTEAIPDSTQARLDRLLEMQQANESPTP